MYLEMQLPDDRSVAACDSPPLAEEERERLAALLQCAYSWSRVQALRQVDSWAATEAGGSLRSQD